MIELYTGTPGSGKSLHCAKVIFNRINHGKNVIANFDINQTLFKGKKRGAFTSYDNSELSPDLLMEYSVTRHKRNTNGHIVEGQTLLIIDECQILFNSRDWQAKDRMGWATFFTQHRKYGFNIILITQFDRLIDRQIRSLVEYQVIHRKISNFKTIGFFIGLLFKGNIFVAVTQWYGMREKTESEIFVLRQKYARLYDSYKIFGAQPERGDGPARGPAEVCAPESVVTEISSASLKQKLIAKLKQFPKLQIKQKQTKMVIPRESQELPKYESLSEFWNPVPPPN